MFSPEDAYLNRSNHKVGKCFECEANFGATDDKQSDKAPPFFNVIKKPSLIPNLEENWSFFPGTAEPQLRFDAPKAHTGIAELGLRAPRC